MAATHHDHASQPHAHGDHGHGHTPGAMDISSQKAMWDGFMRASAFGSMLTLTLVAYLTFVFAVGMDWLVALAVTGVAAFVIGWAMGLGRAWNLTLVGLAGLAVVSRGLAALFAAFI